MSLDDDMEYFTTNCKRDSLDEIRPVIRDWLRSIRSMTSAQAHDWILKSCPERATAERSVSRYVPYLRLDCGNPKSGTGRDYEAMDERPMGHRTQLDFGVKFIVLYKFRK